MLKEVAVGVVIVIAGAVTMLSGGSLAVATPLASVGLWETLSLLSNVIAPVVGAMIAVIVWLHKRINDLEDEQKDLDRSVFGNDRDELNEGVIKEVRNINEKLDRLQESVDRIQRENERKRQLERDENDN